MEQFLLKPSKSFLAAAKRSLGQHCAHSSGSSKVIFARRNFIHCCDMVAPNMSGPACFENSSSTSWWFKPSNPLMYNNPMNALISDLSVSFSHVYLSLSIAFACTVVNYISTDWCEELFFRRHDQRLVRQRTDWNNPNKW